MSQNSPQEPSKKPTEPPDELAQAGLAALVARWHLAWNAKEAQEAIRKNAAAEIERQNAIIGGCRSGCIALGFSPEDKEAWAQVVRVVYPAAREIFNRLRPASFPEWRSKPSSEGSPPQNEKPSSAPAMPRVREVILDRLKEAGDKGDKAANIRQFIETTYSTEIHEKTVGMTLYRLLKRNEVRRKGHTWFFVPPKAGTKNPGASTPGSI
jgi:hypothetical protein